MNNTVTNWYDKLPKDLKKVNTPDKTFKNHYIEPKSRILCIGASGAGKSNLLLEYISRRNGCFYEIIILTMSTADEPLYNLMKQQNPDIKIFTNIDDLPPLQSFENDKENEKLLIIDDFINLTPKEQVKLNEYIISSRKFGFTMWLMSQNYKSVNKLIIRNINYFFIFKLNDMISINNIIRNHNVSNKTKDDIKKMYVISTKQPRDFFLIDLKTNNPQLQFRHNFLGIFK